MTGGTLRCYFCGHGVAPDDRFCPACGAEQIRFWGEEPVRVSPLRVDQGPGAKLDEPSRPMGLGTRTRVNPPARSVRSWLRLCLSVVVFGALGIVGFGGILVDSGDLSSSGSDRAERDYASELARIGTARVASFDRVGLLMDERLFTDVGRQIDLEREIESWHADYRKVRDMEAPPRLVGVHRRYVEVLKKQSLGGQSVVDAVDLYNQGSIESATKFFEDGTQEMLDALVTLRALPDELERAVEE